MKYKCKECGAITTEPIEYKDYTDVGDQSLCYQTYLGCPRCNGDVEEYEEHEDDTDDSEDNENNCIPLF